MYQFDTRLPVDAPDALWALQNFLLEQVEARLGERDKLKTICQPTFHNEPPQLFHTGAYDGVFAKLSCNAKSYWPTAMYELAHETVHFLNPVIGGANYLEEGLAVQFSVEMSSTFTVHPLRPDDGLYRKAVDMVGELPGNRYEVGKLCRSTFGSLDSVSELGLQQIMTGISANLAQRLCVRL